jgi:hypothetical protein
MIKFLLKRQELLVHVKQFIFYNFTNNN